MVVLASQVWVSEFNLHHCQFFFKDPKEQITQLINEQINREFLEEIEKAKKYMKQCQHVNP
jgi:hypothetical protein